MAQTDFVTPRRLKLFWTEVKKRVNAKTGYARRFFAGNTIYIDKGTMDGEMLVISNASYDETNEILTLK